MFKDRDVGKVQGTKESVREIIIELLGEGCWQYAYYNFDLPKLIKLASDPYELAEMIQDLVLRDLNDLSG